MRRLVAIAALIIAALAPPPATAQAYPAATPMARTTAPAQLDALARDREVVERFRRGLDAAARLDWRSSASEFARIVELDPPEPRGSTARYNLGIAEAHLGAYSAAMTAFDDALKRDPGFAAASANLVETALQAGDVPRARRAADQFIAIAPSSLRAHYARGLVALKQDDLATARLDFAAVTAASPDYALAHYDLAVTEIRTGAYGPRCELPVSPFEARPFGRAAKTGWGSNDSSRRAIAHGHLVVTRGPAKRRRRRSNVAPASGSRASVAGSGTAVIVTDPFAGLAARAKVASRAASYDVPPSPAPPNRTVPSPPFPAGVAAAAAARPVRPAAPAAKAAVASTTARSDASGPTQHVGRTAAAGRQRSVEVIPSGTVRAAGEVAAAAAAAGIALETGVGVSGPAGPAPAADGAEALCVAATVVKRATAAAAGDLLLNAAGDHKCATAAACAIVETRGASAADEDGELFARGQRERSGDDRSIAAGRVRLERATVAPAAADRGDLVQAGGGDGVGGLAPGVRDHRRPHRAAAHAHGGRAQQHERSGSGETTRASGHRPPVPPSRPGRTGVRSSPGGRLGPTGVTGASDRRRRLV